MSLRADSGFRDALVLAAARTAGLLACPICATTGTSHDFSHAGGHSFRVACRSCESTWGLRDCRSCDQLFPYIACPDNEPGEGPLDVDRMYGCDVLAFPLEESVFTCTSCGQRSDGEAGSEGAGEAG